MTTTDDTYQAHNRAHWDGQAPGYVEPGEHAWRSPEPYWGIWSIPESTANILPANLRGLDVIELGCGAGYVSAWLARLGANPVGLDLTPGQLATARRFQREIGPEYPLVRAIAERTPFPDECFDLAISEYGAAIWSDPYQWIPEAARILRPGGELICLGNSSLLMLAVPDDPDAAAEPQLLRPQRGMHRFDWEDEPGDPSVEFHLSHGDQIKLFRDAGFEVETLIELYPPEDATTGYPFVTLDWARQWPSEEVWRVRKR